MAYITAYLNAEVKVEVAVSKHFALRPQKRDVLLGTGTGWGLGGGGEEERKSEGSTALTDPEDRGGRGPPPEQSEILRQCPLANAQRLVFYAVAVSAVVRSNHKDNVRSTAVD